MNGKDITITGVMVFILLAVVGCTLGINNVDPQASTSIQEAKKNGYFIAEYSFQQRPTNMFQIEEVWQERTWFYQTTGLFTVTKELRTATSEIYLKVIEKPNSLYQHSGVYQKWALIDDLTGRSLGYNNGLLWLPLDNCSPRDSVSISLWINPRGERQKVGTLLLDLKSR